tara:strand:- start:176 stop:460 length:285 start_codon:yes stop_codon:yes gene_type:complete
MNTKEIINFTKNEIVKHKENVNYWGSEEDVNNETRIINYVMHNSIVNQDWFDERLKSTSIEMLEDILRELYLNHLDKHDEDEVTRDEYIQYFAL